jgi:enoyl-CoA hydratase/carnithine racemase
MSSAARIDQPAADELLYEVRDGIGTITFNRPQARNAMTFAMYERMAEICAEIDADPSIKALILTGAGGKAFAAGTGHLAVPRLQDPGGRDRLREPHRPRARRARALPGADHRGDPGFCTGGGLGIATRCDLRIAVPHAKFGFPIARTLGNCLSMGNYARMAALIGAARVKDIVFTARLVEAQEAHAIGLVTEVVEDAGALMPARRNSRGSSRATRRSPSRPPRRPCAGWCRSSPRSRAATSS